MDLEKKRIDVIERALDIIEMIAYNSKTLSIRDLAAKTGYSKSSIHRIIKTLVGKGYINTTKDNVYTLGAKFLLLKSAKNFYASYIEIVSPIAQEIVNTTGQTVILNVLSGDKGLCIYTLEPRSAVKYVAEVGMTVPFHGGAGGKILLAFAPDDVRKRFLANSLAPFTHNTVTESNTLQNQLDRIRNERLAVSREEFQENAFAIGTPIFSPCGEFLSSFVIAGPIVALNENEDFFVKEVKNTEKKINERLSMLWKFYF